MSTFRVLKRFPQLLRSQSHLSFSVASSEEVSTALEVPVPSLLLCCFFRCFSHVIHHNIQPSRFSLPQLFIDVAVRCLAAFSINFPCLSTFLASFFTSVSTFLISSSVLLQLCLTSSTLLSISHSMVHPLCVCSAGSAGPICCACLHVLLVQNA
jgi:hypothetical protein